MTCIFLLSFFSPARRETRPEWFRSQLGNKMWYAGLGSFDLLDHACGSLPYTLELYCDGRRVDLPPDLEGIVVLNIPSFMGGVDAWNSGVGHVEGARPQGIADRLIEVVGVRGSLHLGQLGVGLSRATNLAQGGHIRIVTRSTFPMQVDGEPWRQEASASCPCEIEVRVRPLCPFNSYFFPFPFCCIHSVQQ
jgi:diacylglycerol kinase (ATP)